MLFSSKGATASSLDGGGWRELKVLPVSWYDGLVCILTKVEDVGVWPSCQLARSRLWTYTPRFDNPSVKQQQQPNNQTNQTTTQPQNNNNKNTIWGGSVLTGEEPPPHSGELNHALSPVGGWPNPIPAIPPYVVRTPHLHGAPITEENS